MRIAVRRRRRPRRRTLRTRARSVDESPRAGKLYQRQTREYRMTRTLSRTLFSTSDARRGTLPRPLPPRVEPTPMTTCVSASAVAITNCRSESGSIETRRPEATGASTEGAWRNTFDTNDAHLNSTFQFVAMWCVCRPRHAYLQVNGGAHRHPCRRRRPNPRRHRVSVRRKHASDPQKIHELQYNFRNNVTYNTNSTAFVHVRVR